MEALNAVWRGPEALPDQRELADPDAWLARVAAPAPPPEPGPSFRTRV